MSLNFLLLIFAFAGSTLAQTGPSITCNYTLSASYYTCNFVIVNPNGADNFTAIQGDHVEGMSDANVTAVLHNTGTSPNIPRIFCSQFPNTEMANFGFTGVESLANNPFAECTNLDWLRLWGNPVGEIPANTFANNQRLEYLDLDNTSLTTLPVNVFNGLNSLELLDLRRNNFSPTLVGGVFRPLGNLRMLYLDHCNLNSINRMWFETLANLEFLYLYRNNITELIADQFIGLRNIRYIDLDSNAISRVEVGAFNSRANLTNILLYNNRIEEIFEDTFVGCYNLVYLDLEQNWISRLHGGAFRSLATLRTLYLNYNRLITLPSNAFEGLSALQNLYINFNEIDDLPEGIFTPINSLSRLGLWRNDIKVLNRNYFSNLTSLRYIDLDYNVVNGLEESILNDMTSLETFYFWGNRCWSGSIFNFNSNRTANMQWLTRCFQNHRFMIDTTTEGNNDYRFFAFPTPGIAVRVNALQDVHISLNPLNIDSIPKIEILIGINNNTRSVIRRNGEEDVVSVPTPNILNNGIWSGFTVVVDNFVILVFQEGQAFPFLGWNMREFYPINFYGLRAPGNVVPWSIQPIG